MSLKHASSNAIDLVRSGALAAAGLALLGLVVLFPRAFETHAPNKKMGLGLKGPDVSHADVPYAEGGYADTSCGGSDSGGSDSGSGTGSGST